MLVGRFISNAWADLFEGAPTCFYALELIPDVDTLALMAVHETAHTLHFQLSYPLMVRRSQRRCCSRASLP